MARMAGASMLGQRKGEARMLEDGQYLLAKRWLNTAVALGYAVTFFLAAAAGFETHRFARPEPLQAPQAARLVAEPEAVLASIR